MKVSGQHHAPAVLPSGKNPTTHWIRVRAGRRAGLGILVKREIPCACRVMNHNSAGAFWDQYPVIRLLIWWLLRAFIF
jgi:hypothetical protein